MYNLLVQGNQSIGHVPYRDSKLTKLLMDSVGGASLCLIVACVTPTSKHREETLNTLQYATRAKRIVNRPRVQLDSSQSDYAMLQQELRVLRNENEYLRSIMVRCKGWVISWLVFRAVLAKPLVVCWQWDTPLAHRFTLIRTESS